MNSLVREQPCVRLGGGLADHASARLEVGPHLEVRLLPVSGGCIGVLIHLVEGELEWVGLISEYVKPKAAPSLVLNGPPRVSL